MRQDLLRAGQAHPASSAFSRFLGVSLGLTLYQASSDLALLVDQERRADDAHVRPAVELLLAPHAVRLGDLVLGVRQQREPERVLVVELLLLLGQVGADAEDGGVADVAGDVAEEARLRGAAGRVGLRVEVHQHLATLVRAEAGERALLVLEADGRRLVPGLEFVVCHAAQAIRPQRGRRRRRFPIPYVYGRDTRECPLRQPGRWRSACPTSRSPCSSAAGAFVGFVVGLTGMGGGALMTPLLVLLFKINPSTAVGSDLVVSLVMKPVGGGVHLRKGTVNLPIVKWLVIGSVPSAFLERLGAHPPVPEGHGRHHPVPHRRRAAAGLGRADRQGRLLGPARPHRRSRWS